MIFEPAQKNFVLITYAQVPLKTLILMHPAKLEVKVLVLAFIYIQTLCMRPAKALASLHICCSCSLMQYVFLFDSLRLSQQFFSYVVTGLPVLNQY